MDKALWGKSGHTGKSIRTRIETWNASRTHH